MTCTSTIVVTADKTNLATVRGVTAGGNPATDSDDADVEILAFGLTIEKSNDAPHRDARDAGRLDGRPADSR